MSFSTWKRHPSRRLADARQIRLRLESLEDRVVPSAVTTVYTESNSPTANTVLAFQHNASGILTQVASYNTSGAGLSNPNLLIGPDDSSQEVITTANGRFLFAVNQGSNSVSAFSVAADGTLTLVGTFASGGVQPDSLGLSGNILSVSNRGTSTFNGTAGTASTVAPNITGFQIGSNGALTPLAGSTVTFPMDTSPSQNLITPNGKLLFADIFAVPAISSTPSAQSNTLIPYQIGANGTLTLAPGGGLGAPVPAGVPPLLIGASFNPNQPIIYDGVAKANAVAVYTYDQNTGQLTYVREVPVQGTTTCWSVVSADGKYLYTGDNGTDSVGVFSLTDPENPVQIQELYLDGGSASANSSAESKVFQIMLSPDGTSLYVVSQAQNSTFPNELHTLSVNTTTGMLTEPNSPAELSIGSTLQPQGVAVVTSQTPATVPPPATTTVYTESNNPTANAVLAFQHNASGILTQVASYNTGGTGLSNPALLIGPNDSSQEVITTANGNFLFAVNQGSNSVSAFSIGADGALALIGTFASGGVQPDSLGLSGNFLYVSNRGDSTFNGTAGTASTVAPNITGFQIGSTGALTALSGSTVTFPTDTSPSQNLITPNGKLLFADIFAVPAISSTPSPQSNTLIPYQISATGALTLAPGGGLGAPVPAGVPPLLIGAAFNPNQPIIYDGVAKANAVAVYTYDQNTGQLTYVRQVPVQGTTTCWSVVSADGKYLYTGDNGTDSVGVFSLADPKNPVQIQELYLDGGSASANASAESKVFQIMLSPDGTSLYVVSQAQNSTFPNELHTLSVNTTTGMLTEPNSPAELSIGSTLQPQGVAVVTNQTPATAPPPAMTTVYTESNNPTANTVLAFQHNASGILTQVASYNTGGMGLSNPNLLIGPNDSSQEVVTTADGRFLFAVNQGSNSISAFSVAADGTLALVGTFASGGVQPDSLGLSGNFLYVSNRGDSTFNGTTGTASTVMPNITGFQIGSTGALTPLSGSTVTFPMDTSPSQNLITPNGKLLFADIFAVPAISSTPSPQSNTLIPYQIGANGTLTLAPGGGLGAPVPAGVPPLLIGAAFNPNQPIIYDGVAKANAVAVYTYDQNTGQLTYVRQVSVQGTTTCWTVVSADGKYLYTGDNGTDSVGVFSLADPENPVQIQELYLDGGSASANSSAESKVFQIMLSPDGTSLYVVSQAQNSTFPNELHTLSVNATTGMLTEPNSPTQLSIGSTLQPQGVAVVTSQTATKVGTFVNGVWELDTLGNGGAPQKVTYGLPGDMPIVGDWNGAGYDEIGVVRTLTNFTLADGHHPLQFILNTTGTGIFTSSDTVFTFGESGDQIVLGDWNGDGKTKIGVVRPGSNGALFWSLDYNGSFVTSQQFLVYQYGLGSDSPVVGDWSGQGKDEIGVVRATGGGALEWVLNTNGTGTFASNDSVFVFGAVGDNLLVGDWTGSGTTKIGVSLPASNGLLAFALDKQGNGMFTPSDTAFYGLATDQGLVGDWTGTGVDRIGVDLPATNAANLLFTLDSNGDGMYDSGDEGFGFGESGGQVVVGRWQPF